MRIGVIGATGFIGSEFCQLAFESGHEVVGFSRRSKPDGELMTWRLFDESPDFSGLDAIVNYAGESVAQRWTEKKKRKFYESRVGVTQTIVRGISALPEGERPQVLMNASAVGYYGDAGEEKLDESSPKGNGYLADLCLEWETAAREAEALGVRVVLGRIGIVLGKNGAAWEQMRKAFLLGAGGPLGSGRQWMPWVNVTDVAGASLFSIENVSLSGVVNLVSPNPVTNKEFTKVLAKHLSRPAFIPAPEFALRLVFGEFGKHLLDSYQVYPKALLDAGYKFRSGQLNKCLKQLDG